MIKIQIVRHDRDARQEGFRAIYTTMVYLNNYYLLHLTKEEVWENRSTLTTMGF